MLPSVILSFGLLQRRYKWGLSKLWSFLGPYYNTGPNTGPNLEDPKRNQNFDNPPKVGKENGTRNGNRDDSRLHAMLHDSLQCTGFTTLEY